jgi:hypothetical protein
MTAITVNFSIITIHEQQHNLWGQVEGHKTKLNKHNILQWWLDPSLADTTIKNFIWSGTQLHKGVSIEN